MSESRDSADWPSEHAPKQSITEVLQNPRSSSLEIRDSAFDFTSPSSKRPTSTRTESPTVNINHFEQYLRELAPLYDEAPLSPETGVARDPEARAVALSQVPPAYFEQSFSVANCEELADLQQQPVSGATKQNATPFDHDAVVALRAKLASYTEALQTEMQVRMNERAMPIADALDAIRELRQSILATAQAVAAAKENTQKVVTDVTSSILQIDDVVAVKNNTTKVLETLQLMQRVRSTSEDVKILLETGQYSGAIDAVHASKEALQSPELRHINALGPARAKLARSVETIHNSLHGEFQKLTRTPDEELDEGRLLEVALLISRIGRMQILKRTYLQEFGAQLDAQLSSCTSIEQACKQVRISVHKAARVIRSLHLSSESPLPYQGSSSDKLTTEPESDSAEISLSALLSLAQESLCAVIDRLLGTFPVSRDPSGSHFIVVLAEESITPVNYFDEAKGPIRFGETMRSLNALADELSQDLGVDNKSGRLRSKCRERLLAFLGAFHKAHTETITNTIMTDKWKEMAVPDGTLRLIGSVAGPEQETSMENVTSDVQTNKVSSNSTQSKGVPVIIKGHSYFTVRSGLRYARSLCAYTLIADKLPIVSSEVARRAVELSLLFNSMVGKSILGAAALEWTGLRSITARHLSLASRTVAMSASLAAAAHQSLNSVLSQNQHGVVVPLMEKAEADFRNHRDQILAKILAVMMERLAVHIDALQELPWNKELEMHRFEIPSPYITMLGNESGILHRILWAVLPSSEALDIFKSVCVAYGSQLDSAFRKLDSDKLWIRQRISSDVTFLFDKLSVLDVFVIGDKSALEPIEMLFRRFVVEFDAAPSDDVDSGSPPNADVVPADPALAVDPEPKQDTPTADGPTPTGTIVPAKNTDPGSDSQVTEVRSVSDNDETIVANGIEPSDRHCVKWEDASKEDGSSETPRREISETIDENIEKVPDNVEQVKVSSLGNSENANETSDVPTNSPPQALTSIEVANGTSDSISSLQANDEKQLNAESPLETSGGSKEVSISNPSVASEASEVQSEPSKVKMQNDIASDNEGAALSEDVESSRSILEESSRFVKDKVQLETPHTDQNTEYDNSKSDGVEESLGSSGQKCTEVGQDVVSVADGKPEEAGSIKASLSSTAHQDSNLSACTSFKTESVDLQNKDKGEYPRFEKNETVEEPVTSTDKTVPVVSVSEGVHEEMEAGTNKPAEMTKLTSVDGAQEMKQ